MENILLLNLNKPSILEFEVDIKGVDLNKPITVRFNFTVNEITYSFNAKQDIKDKKNWTVIIPKMKEIPKTTYPFKIEVISDGYFFEALKGAVNVEQDEPFAKAEVKTPEKKVDVVKKEEVKKEVKEEIKSNSDSVVKEEVKIIPNTKPIINKDVETKTKKIIEDLQSKKDNIKQPIAFKKGNIITN